jgi:hypothetical protein
MTAKEKVLHYAALFFVLYIPVILFLGLFPILERCSLVEMVYGILQICK